MSRLSPLHDRTCMLRMLFVCCHEALPRDGRLVLALKTLCGFGVGEIAFRLFTSEANVYKRLARARERLREVGVDTQTPTLEALTARLPTVHAVLYLLFNEGYLSTRPEHAICAVLCEEAIRLARPSESYVQVHPAPSGESPRYKRSAKPTVFLQKAKRICVFDSPGRAG